MVEGGGRGGVEWSGEKGSYEGGREGNLSHNWNDTIDKLCMSPPG